MEAKRELIKPFNAELTGELIAILPSQRNIAKVAQFSNLLANKLNEVIERLNELDTEK